MRFYVGCFVLFFMGTAYAVSSGGKVKNTLSSHDFETKWCQKTDTEGDQKASENSLDAKNNSCSTIPSSNVHFFQQFVSWSQKNSPLIQQACQLLQELPKELTSLNFTDSLFYQKKLQDFWKKNKKSMPSTLKQTINGKLREIDPYGPWNNQCKFTTPQSPEKNFCNALNIIHQIIYFANAGETILNPKLRAQILWDNFLSDPKKLLLLYNFFDANYLGASKLHHSTHKFLEKTVTLENAIGPHNLSSSVLINFSKFMKKMVANEGDANRLREKNRFFLQETPHPLYNKLYGPGVKFDYHTIIKYLNRVVADKMANDPSSPYHDELCFIYQELTNNDQLLCH
ncbi:MAG: hypothetical protein HQK52_18470 [Oligoflexia bacterium]|nr:hypothetical protein [Oligoflexia bacterium]